MNLNQCCRACLNSKDLYPIFGDSQFKEQYSATTGDTLDGNDKYPKVLCTKCVVFINQCIEFRKKCNKSLEILSIRLSRKVIYNEVSNDSNTNDMITLNNVESIVNNIKKEIDDSNDLNEITIIDYDELNVKTETVILKESEKLIKKRKIKKVKSKTITRPPYTECDICKKMVKSNRYDTHKKFNCGRPLVCEHCGRTFASRNKLLSHCKSKHGYQKTDKCSYCDYLGSSVQSVKLHERSHTGEKPYTCEVCGAAFHRVTGYSQHMPIHLTKKTIQCTICPMMFKSLSHMRVHRDRIHKESKYIYKCGDCEAIFARRCNLVKHLKKQHKHTDSEAQKQVIRLLKNESLL